MTTESLSILRFRRGERRGGGVPGLAPILFAVTVWVVWIVGMEPFAAMRNAVRAGLAVSAEALFVAVVSAIGVLAMVPFAVAVGAYLLAVRAARRSP
jgi:hypothetical protein